MTQAPVTEKPATKAPVTEQAKPTPAPKAPTQKPTQPPTAKPKAAPTKKPAPIHENVKDVPPPQPKEPMKVITKEGPGQI